MTPQEAILSGFNFVIWTIGLPAIVIRLLQLTA